MCIKYRVKGFKGCKRRITVCIVFIGLYIWSVWRMIWQAIKKACDGVFLSLCDIINILIMRFKARNAHLKPFKCVRRTRYRLQAFKRLYVACNALYRVRFTSLIASDPVYVYFLFYPVSYSVYTIVTFLTLCILCQLCLIKQVFGFIIGEQMFCQSKLIVFIVDTIQSNRRLGNFGNGNQQAEKGKFPQSG